MKLVNETFDNDFFDIIQNAVQRRLSETGRKQNITVKLAKTDGLSDGAYALSYSDNCYIIKSSTKCGFWAGIGTLLRKGENARIGMHKPLKKYRGMYFATHFHNFYNDAPIERVNTYIEDLALWGQNWLMLWYDMHHFSSAKAIESVKLAKRLKSFINHADKIGMSTALMMLANEAYSSSPEPLRAQWDVRGKYLHNLTGHYHVELCPSKEGGLDEILAERRQMLSLFADSAPQAVIIWPYDQGGCTCPECEPWGVNGFLKTAYAVKALAKEIFPTIKTGISTWYFDKFIKGERKEFYKNFHNNTDFDFIMCFQPQSDESLAAALLDFPEISMYGAVPWGGFGANPIIDVIGRVWNNSKTNDGGFPYSEGIFEDINKAMLLSLYYGDCHTVTEALKEYIDFEFDNSVTDELSDIIHKLGMTLWRHRIDEVGNNHDYPNFAVPWVGKQRFVIDNTEYVKQLYNSLLKVLPQMQPIQKTSWRFRIIELRILIDYELLENGFLSNTRIEEYLSELTEIYYAQYADYCVAPPTEEAIRINRGNFA